jgi:hypothetical protein
MSTRERPILMSAPMVRALLAGTKTQTRRVLKVPALATTYRRTVGGVAQFWNGDPVTGPSAEVPCPCGQPGDRLWVREAWSSGRLTDRFAPREMTPHQVWYEADGPAPEACSGKLRPGMFMPRWASRISLEVTGVRVERLQDISEADAIAEGAATTYLSPSPTPRGYRDGYWHLWNSINGPGAWDSNPFVWCVSFRVIRP